MTWTVDGTTYTFYNPEGQAIVWTSNFDYAMILIRELNAFNVKIDTGKMEKRDEQSL